MERVERCYEKYKDTIDSVSEEEGVEIAVAVDMVASVCNVRTGRIEAAEDYQEYLGVPDDFDCEEFLATYGEKRRTP